MAEVTLEAWQALKDEVESIAKDLGSEPSDTTANRLTKAAAKLQDLKDPSVLAAWLKEGAQLEGDGALVGREEMHYVPATLVVIRVGTLQPCRDCSLDPCVCFTGLPKPHTITRPDGSIKVEFVAEAWTHLDRYNWLQANRLKPISKVKV